MKQRFKFWLQVLLFVNLVLIGCKQGKGTEPLISTESYVVTIKFSVTDHSGIREFSELTPITTEFKGQKELKDVVQFVENSYTYNSTEYEVDKSAMYKDPSCLKVIEKISGKVTVYFKVKDLFSDFKLSADKKVLEKYLGSSETVIVPKIVTVIEKNAFDKNSNLKKIILPEGLTHINDEAFQQCYNLENIQFPSTLESIGYASFYDCNKLKSIDLSNTNLKTIEKSAFFKTQLESIKFPQSLQNIGNHAFKFIETLKEVDLSNTKLQKISLQTFLKCKNLETVKLPVTATVLEKDAFFGCTMLKTIDLANVSSIGESAFGECKNLQTIDLTNVNSIGKSAFDNCKIEKVIFQKDLNDNEFKLLLEKSFSVTTNKCYIFNIDLSKTSIIKIPDSAFNGNSKVKTLIFPITLKIIGKEAFNGCTGLSGDYIFDFSKTQLEIIGEGAFCASSVKKIKLPNSILKIEPNAFYLSYLEGVYFEKDENFNGWKVYDSDTKIADIDFLSIPSDKKPVEFAILLKNEDWSTPNGYAYYTFKKE